jgi:hypothetical protein
MLAWVFGFGICCAHDSREKRGGRFSYRVVSTKDSSAEISELLLEVSCPCRITHLLRLPITREHANGQVATLSDRMPVAKRSLRTSGAFRIELADVCDRAQRYRSRTGIRYLSQCVPEQTRVVQAVFHCFPHRYIPPFFRL